MAGPNGAYCTCPKGWPKGLEEPKPKNELDKYLDEKTPVSGIDDLDMLEKEIDDLIEPLDLSKHHTLRRRLMHKVEAPKNAYLPFDCRMAVDGKSWVMHSQPQLPFKPEALMLFGFNDESFIDYITVGYQIQGAVSPGRVPAAMWGTALTYEKLLEQFKANGISPPSWITWSICHIGCIVTIHGTGKLTGAVMLGKAVY